jgi:hypothetical protein
VFARIDSPFSENIESSDYLQKGDVGFKKPKVRFSSSFTFTSDSVPPHQTKKKRPTRRLAEDSDIVPVSDQMEIDIKPAVPRVRDLDVNFVDDDELQAALASSRRAKIKIKKVSPEEIARRGQFSIPSSLSIMLMTNSFSCGGARTIGGALYRRRDQGRGRRGRGRRIRRTGI